ncbi:MAG: hypothetical protein WBR18_02070, partial [Anaerolineales bacterium]
MEVRLVGLGQAGTASGGVRVSARIVYRNRWARPDILWFEVPADLAQQVTSSSDPWLVALLPLAVTLQEEIRILGLPSDPVLRSNLDRLMSVWHSWYPELAPIPILTETGVAMGSSNERRRAAFFSGGVDSYYTVLKDRKEHTDAIDELILVHGFDIRIGNQPAFSRAQASVNHAATIWGLPLTVVRTNLRETNIGKINWTYLSSGPSLAASALILGPRYRQVLIPSTGRQRLDLPVGTHPLTDPLLSTSGLSFVHHGDGADRIAKTAFISNFRVALENLRVCWESPYGDNCGRCSKCLRTMATLEVLDKLADCPVFPDRAQLARRISRLYLGHELPFMLQ